MVPTASNGAPTARSAKVSLLKSAAVAAHLYMSEATVKAHVSRLFTKLDATNREQVAIVVHDAGLV
jgi:DNA-binding NarL/FixJ family response regulator